MPRRAPRQHRHLGNESEKSFTTNRPKTTRMTRYRIHHHGNVSLNDKRIWCKIVRNRWIGAIQSHHNLCFDPPGGGVFHDEDELDYYEDRNDDNHEPQNVHLEAAEIVERALHGDDHDDDDDLPTPIFIDHLYESNYIPATESFCTTSLD